MTEPPVARVHDEIVNGPGLIVDEQSLDMSEVAVARVNMKFQNSIATAQVGIVPLVL